MDSTSASDIQHTRLEDTHDLKMRIEVLVANTKHMSTDMTPDEIHAKNVRVLQAMEKNLVKGLKAGDLEPASLVSNIHVATHRESGFPVVQIGTHDGRPVVLVSSWCVVAYDRDGLLEPIDPFPITVQLIPELPNFFNRGVLGCVLRQWHPLYGLIQYLMLKKAVTQKESKYTKVRHPP
jgi:hypothetical protein